MLDRPLPKDLVQAARAISDASSIKSSQSKGATLAQSQVPLTFHCLSLPFHCLSSPSHCLSLPSHCRYIDPSLTSPQAGSPVRKMDKELYAAILLYTGNSIYAALNKVLRNEDRMSRPCPCPCPGPAPGPAPASQVSSACFTVPYMVRPGCQEVLRLPAAVHGGDGPHADQKSDAVARHISRSIRPIQARQCKPITPSPRPRCLVFRLLPSAPGRLLRCPLLICCAVCRLSRGGQSRPRLPTRTSPADSWPAAAGHARC